MTTEPFELMTVLRGALEVAVLVLVLGAVAVALDWLVRWLRRKDCSNTLCGLLHRATLLIAAIDLAVAVAYAAAHAWEVRPAVLRPAQGQGVPEASVDQHL